VENRLLDSSLQVKIIELQNFYKFFFRGMSFLELPFSFGGGGGMIGIHLASFPLIAAFSSKKIYFTEIFQDNLN